MKSRWTCAGSRANKLRRYFHLGNRIEAFRRYLTQSCALHHILVDLQCVKYCRRLTGEVGVVSATEAAKPMPSTRRNVLRSILGNALPLIGLALAVVVNAAWIGLLGYFVLKLV
jgi:hypothetical protein